MKLTKSQIESLRSVSVRGEVYVHLDDLRALLSAEGKAEDERKAALEGKGSASADRAEGS